MDCFIVTNFFKLFVSLGPNIVYQKYYPSTWIIVDFSVAFVSYLVLKLSINRLTIDKLPIEMSQLKSILLILFLVSSSSSSVDMYGFRDNRFKLEHISSELNVMFVIKLRKMLSSPIVRLVVVFLLFFVCRQRFYFSFAIFLTFNQETNCLYNQSIECFD